MKSPRLVVLIVILFSISILGNNTNFGLAQNGGISGSITTNTTWTLSNSPYNFVGDVTVAAGVTLTIEPGVLIDFTEYQPSTDLAGRPSHRIVTHNLQIDGTLHANGNTFSTKYGTSITFSQTSTDSIIQNAHFYGGFHLGVLGSSPEISGNSFNSFSLTITINIGSPIIKSNYFAGIDMTSDIFTVDGGSAVISNNSINDDTRANAFISLTGESTAVVSDNNISGLFKDSAIIVASGNPVFERNFISNHNDDIWPMKAIGMSIYGNAKPVIKSNTIANNKIGLNVYDSKGSPSLTLSNNNFEQNSQYKIYLGQEGVYGTTAPDINASNNWWGTTDTSVISQSIFDHKNNNNLGTVTFEPMLTSHNPLAIPTGLPSTTSPSYTPSNPIATPSNPTSIPSQNPTSILITPIGNSQAIPQKWLYGIIAALVSMVVVLLVVLVYARKKVHPSTNAS